MLLNTWLSHSDLINWLGYDLEGATRHYVQAGYEEGRTIDRFDAAQYLASHSDLLHWLGYDLEGATRHYIKAGHREGRTVDSFNENSVPVLRQ